MVKSKIVNSSQPKRREVLVEEVTFTSLDDRFPRDFPADQRLIDQTTFGGERSAMSLAQKLKDRGFVILRAAGVIGDPDRTAASVVADLVTGPKELMDLLNYGAEIGPFVTHDSKGSFHLFGAAIWMTGEDLASYCEFLSDNRNQSSVSPPLIRG